MANTLFQIRISQGMKDEMREMALAMGFLTVEGEPNISAYLRACHRLAKHQFEQGLIKPGSVSYPPQNLEDEDVRGAA